MKRPISHLSIVPNNARLLCWHPTEDLAAFLVGTEEYLLAEGRVYHFKAETGSPAQLVCTLRTLPAKEFKRCMRLLPTTFTPLTDLKQIA